MWWEGETGRTTNREINKWKINKWICDIMVVWFKGFQERNI